MPTSKLSLRASVALALLVYSTSVSADGGCEKGYRDTTAAERSAVARVLDAAKAGLPSAPTGWVVTSDSVGEAPQNLCKDQEGVPWTYGVTRYFQRTDDQAEQNQKMQTAAKEMTTSLAAKQPRLDAIMAKMTPLSQEVAAAAQKSDWARVEELNKEIEKVSAEYKAVLEEGDANAKMEAVVAEASQDHEIIVALEVNSGFEWIDEGAASFPTPPGAKAAYRWSGTRGDAKEDNVLVVLGNWKAPAEGHVEGVFAPGTPVEVAQNMAVRVSAAAGRVADVVGSIDFNRLAATLSK